MVRLNPYSITGVTPILLIGMLGFKEVNLSKACGQLWNLDRPLFSWVARALG
jgi:hypothetical protein